MFSIRVSGKVRLQCMEYASKECVLFLWENAVCRRANHVLVLIC